MKPYSPSRHQRSLLYESASSFRLVCVILQNQQFMLGFSSKNSAASIGIKTSTSGTICLSVEGSLGHKASVMAKVDMRKIKTSRNLPRS